MKAITMAEQQIISVSSLYNIRGLEYTISMDCKGEGTVLVQVEDRLSADQWRATFDSHYIEDLTHKTGNFKQFNIFVSMLESAISKTSDSVSLDLLTYNDLESLRQKKSGVSSNVKSSVVPPRSSSVTTKRYLILTYTVEFDRIHYPLPLPYAGKPDPQALQDEVRFLRTEMKKTRQQQPVGDQRTDKLLRDFRRLEREKAELEQEFAEFRREVRLSSGGNAVKDIRTLKAVVKSLEEQLMKEKTRYQRSTNKRSQEYRDLLEEVEELRASERNLRVRLKSLTNELAMYKRGRPTTRTVSKERAGSGDRLSATRNGSASRMRSLSNDRISGRLASGDRLTSSRDRLVGAGIKRSNSSEQISARGSGSSVRARSNSWDRNNSANRSNLSAGSNRSRTPSPSARRFNPTAYIKEKERKLRETSLKKKRERGNYSGLSSRSKNSPNSSRNSGYSSRLLREESIGSQGNISDGYGSDGSYISRSRHNSGGSLRGSRQGNSVENSPRGPSRPARSNRPPTGKANIHITKAPSNTQKKAQSRPHNARNMDSDDGDESDVFDRSAEISEIDERLDRLQQLMQVAMP